MKKLYFLGTGGIAQSLFLLGNCINYASKYNYTIFPILEVSNSFRINFYDLYDVNEEYKEDFCSENHLRNLRKIEFKEQTIDISKIKLKHAKNYTYIIEDLNHNIEDLKIVKNRICTLNNIATTGHFKTIQYHIPLLSRWHKHINLKKSIEVLKLKPKILKFIKDKNLLISKNYIGVHFRNSDMSHSFYLFYLKVLILSSITNIKNIYWATDDNKSLLKVRLKMPHLNIMNFSCTDIKNSINFLNLHNLSDEELKLMGITKNEQLMEVFLDIYTLSKSTFFIGSRKSSLTKMVRICRKKFKRCEINFFE